MITEKRKKRLAEMLSIMRDDKISREIKDKLMDKYYNEFLGAEYVESMGISKNLISVTLSPKALASNLEDWVPCCTQAKWVVDSLDKAEFKIFMS